MTQVIRPKTSNLERPWSLTLNQLISNNKIEKRNYIRGFLKNNNSNNKDQDYYSYYY